MSREQASSMGRIVHFRLPDEVVLAGDGSYVKERIRPAIVVRTIGKTSILHVFLDPAADRDVSAADYVVRSAHEGSSIGQWRWPLIAPKAETLADVEAELAKEAP